MKTIARYIGLSLLVGIISFVVSYKAAPHGRPSPQTPSPVPFSLSLKMTNSTGTVIAIEKVARRSDGATFSSGTDLTGTPPVTQSLLEFPDGNHINIIPSLKQKNTWPRRTGRGLEFWRGQRLPTDACRIGSSTQIGTDKVGTEPVIGYEYVVSRFKFTTWLAPRLGCQKLEYRSEDASTGALLVQGTTTELNYGEPDPKLFEVPHYTETKPSITQRQLVLQSGGTPTADDEAQWKRLDNKYDARAETSSPLSPAN